VEIKQNILLKNVQMSNTGCYHITAPPHPHDQ